MSSSVSRRDREAERGEARGEARDAQHAQRVFANAGETWRSTRAVKIGAPRPRIDELAVFGRARSR